MKKKVEEMGYPLLRTGFAIVPFDIYSSYHRGTLESMVDMYENPDVVLQFCKAHLEHQLQSIRMQAKFMPGKWIFIPLNKGMDGFMTAEQYEKFYWKVKKNLGDTACITGGFPIQLLHDGTKQAVIDECKRLIDICAPGGGYIFGTSAGFDHAKPENVEAMFETVKEYGKYR